MWPRMPPEAAGCPQAWTREMWSSEWDRPIPMPAGDVRRPGPASRGQGHRHRARPQGCKGVRRPGPASRGRGRCQGRRGRRTGPASRGQGRRQVDFLLYTTTHDRDLNPQAAVKTDGRGVGGMDDGGVRRPMRLRPHWLAECGQGAGVSALAMARGHAASAVLCSTAVPAWNRAGGMHSDRGSFKRRSGTNPTFAVFPHVGVLRPVQYPGSAAFRAAGRKGRRDGWLDRRLPVESAPPVPPWIVAGTQEGLWLVRPPAPHRRPGSVPAAKRCKGACVSRCQMGEGQDPKGAKIIAGGGRSCLHRE